LVLVAKRLEVLFDFRENKKKTLTGGKNKEKFNISRKKRRKEAIHEKEQVIGLVYGSLLEDEQHRHETRRFCFEFVPENKEKVHSILFDIISFHFSAAALFSLSHLNSCKSRK
jgi:uncharacterized protein (UPF0548 family)